MPAFQCNFCNNMRRSEVEKNRSLFCNLIWTKELQPIATDRIWQYFGLESCYLVIKRLPSIALHVFFLTFHDLPLPSMTLLASLRPSCPSWLFRRVWRSVARINGSLMSHKLDSKLPLSPLTYGREVTMPWKGGNRKQSFFLGHLGNRMRQGFGYWQAILAFIFSPCVGTGRQTMTSGEADRHWSPY